MRVLSTPLGFTGAALSLVFWIAVPAVVSNSYIHAGQEGMDVAFAVLSLVALAGSLLARARPGWGSLLMALGIVPAAGALVIPGLLLALAAITAAEAPEGRPETPAGLSRPRRAGPALAPSVAAGRRRSALSEAAMPQPVDLSFGGRPGTVVFHRPSDGAEVGSCVGPGSDGRCPRALGGQVPCAGCILSLPLAVRGARDWHVPEGYRTCFLGGYDVYRQAG